MRWRGRETSSNVEDRRGGFGGGSAKKVGGIGCGTIVLLLIASLFVENPLQLLQQIQPEAAPQSVPAPNQPQANDDLGQFVGVVLKDTEDVWKKLFQQNGRRYVEPTLVLFSGQDRSACGFASAATGPFYCPADQKVYIDLSFYRDLKERFKAPGDFAMAYVISHEVAHHVQYLLGITTQVDQQRRSVSKAQANDLSVRLELQADFLAGVWAHHAQKMKDILEEGDIQEALGAANAIGDDRLQMQSQGYVVPDAFTHGTSEQRMRWFKKGLQSGDLSQMDTFNVPNL